MLRPSLMFQNVAFAFAFAVAHAQTTPTGNPKEPTPVRDSAGHVANGHYWRGLSEGQQNIYLRGLVEATVVLCLAFDANKETELCAGLHDALNADVVEQVTKLYGDPANLSIPVALVAPIAIQRLAGLSDEETSHRLSVWRRTVADSLPGTAPKPANQPPSPGPLKK